MKSYLFRMTRAEQTDRTIKYTSMIQRDLAMQPQFKTFESEDEFERVRADIFPNEPTTKQEILEHGSVQRDNKMLTDSQAASLGWLF